MNPSAALKKSLPTMALAIALVVMGAVGGRWWAHHDATATPVAAAPSTQATQTAPVPGNVGVDRKVLYWYDPMQPTQKFDHPGKSPFMDMPLTPRYADEAQSAEAALGVSNQARQSLGLRLAMVERTVLSSSVDAVAIVQFSERDVSIVQARTAGFVERVYARAPGDVIAAGSPLVDVLNPEWAGAQQEYLAVRAMNDPPLAQAARSRLRLLGMSESLIARVEAAGLPIPVITIAAPRGGVLVELAVRQGMTLSPGMTLARINGLGTVWLELALPEAQAGALAVGQTVQARLSALPGKVLTGKVATILPQANADTRTLRVRVELPNPGGRLRAGMFAQATLRSASQAVLAVPSDAVIRTGTRALVYLAGDDGRFRPIEVEVGAERDGKIEVRSGLSAGQQVVASGQFLIDSEASTRGIRPAPALGAGSGEMSTRAPGRPAAEVRSDRTNPPRPQGARP